MTIELKLVYHVFPTWAGCNGYELQTWSHTRNKWVALRYSRSLEVISDFCEKYGWQLPEAETCKHEN